MRELARYEKKMLQELRARAIITCPARNGPKDLESWLLSHTVGDEHERVNRWLDATHADTRAKEWTRERRRRGAPSEAQQRADERSEDRMRQLGEDAAMARRAHEEQEEKARLAETQALKAAELARNSTQQRVEAEKRADAARARAAEEQERSLVLRGLWEDAETKLRIERKLAPLGPYHARLEWFHKSWGLIDAFSVLVTLGTAGIVATLYVLSRVGYLSSMIAVAAFGLGVGALTTFLLIYGVLIVKLRRPQPPLIGPLFRQVKREDGEGERESDL